MSEIENTLPNDHLPKDEVSSVRKKKPLSRIEKLQDTLLIVSIAQLILALLLYMTGCVAVLVILIEGALAVALAALSHFKFEMRIPRIILRILSILFTVLPVIAWGLFIISFYFEAVQYNDVDVMQTYLAYFWSTFAVAITSPLLFLQPVYIIHATARRRFDLVMLRIVTIFTFISSIVLCVFALSFQSDGEQLINTSTTFSPVIFGHQITYTIAIDTVITRILFCACSAALVVCSFLVHSKKKEKQINTVDKK